MATAIMIQEWIGQMQESGCAFEKFEGQLTDAAILKLIEDGMDLDVTDAKVIKNVNRPSYEGDYTVELKSSTCFVWDKR